MIYLGCATIQRILLVQQVHIYSELAQMGLEMGGAHQEGVQSVQERSVILFAAKVGIYADRDTVLHRVWIYIFAGFGSSPLYVFIVDCASEKIVF